MREGVSYLGAHDYGAQDYGREHATLLAQSKKKTPGTNGDFEFIFLNTPDFESKFSLTVLIVDFLFNTLLNYFRWRIILPQTAFLL